MKVLKIGVPSVISVGHFRRSFPSVAISIIKKSLKFETTNSMGDNIALGVEQRIRITLWIIKVCHLRVLLKVIISIKLI